MTDAQIEIVMKDVVKDVMTDAQIEIVMKDVVKDVMTDAQIETVMKDARIEIVMTDAQTEIVMKDARMTDAMKDAMKDARTKDVMKDAQIETATMRREGKWRKTQRRTSLQTTILPPLLLHHLLPHQRPHGHLTLVPDRLLRPTPPAAPDLTPIPNPLLTLHPQRVPPARPTQSLARSAAVSMLTKHMVSCACLLSFFCFPCFPLRKRKSNGPTTRLSFSLSFPSYLLFIPSSLGFILTFSSPLSKSIKIDTYCPSA
eukprot:TRINITY_DN8504_c0_g2_i4.p1 TRINITY_DN8504_c0_g2~~TRINITY_DN8504_c0_g2_i4.p1  ORF type:complete len:271 (-),score=38.40 TRINITY_DN8504_c0_g2_i4:177-947(-)